MVSTAKNLAVLLRALGLTQGGRKPMPSSSTMASAYVHNNLEPSQGIEYQSQPVAETSPVSGAQLDKTSTDCSVPPYYAQNFGVPGFSPFDQAKATVYRYRQQQSVNLGSWFVHEQWMVPSLFTCAAGNKASEIDIASGWGSVGSARAVLERHWDTFINESDFQYLAGIGINTVRLPIGYWSLGPAFCQGTPYEPVASVYQNSWSRVVRAINWAADANIGVLVDLHGAPGSQNGQQHSGISDGQTNLFGNGWYTNKTMAVLTFLMQELVNVTNVVGIQILNEPNNVEELPDFYSTAISTMRQVSPAAANFPLYIHDGFDLGRFSDFVANRSDFVVEDHHSYFVFTPSDDSEPASQHTADVHDWLASSLATASKHQRRNLVVDEFSCALTDQSLANEQDPNQARRDFCQGQVEVYQNNTAGWAFWAYNKEDCFDDPGWCFKAAVGKSLPSTFFSYGQNAPMDPSRVPTLNDINVDMGPLPLSAPQEAPSPSPAYPTFSPRVGIEFPYERRSRRVEEYRPRFLRWQRRNQSRKRDEITQLPVDPSERAVAKGYSDGFLTAKIFARYGMSKLGFIGQYIDDSIALLGPTIIEPVHEDYYKQWFMKGLRDGQALVSSYVNGTSAVTSNNSFVTPS